MEKGPKVSRRRFLKWGAAGLAAGTVGGIVGGGMVRTERTLRLPRWRADGFRVAQVSDVHVNNGGQLAAARQAVGWAVEAKPDLFVFTGDFLNYGTEEAFANIAPAFEALRDIGCPCLAIFGNHDYWTHVPEKVAAHVAKTPLRLLVNEAVDVGGVRVVGLDDALGGSPDYGLVAARDASSTLALLHEPDFAVNLPPAGLVLSGHSHGGEICLPGGAPLYTPPGARRYRSGYYPRASAPIFVNRGTATLGPARVYCPPEVAILTLKAA